MGGALSRGQLRLRNSADASDSPRSQAVRIDAAPAIGPIRSCRVCRQRLPQAELTRWVVRQGVAVSDPARRLPGRGLYSCSDTCAARIPEIIKRTKR